MHTPHNEQMPDTEFDQIFPRGEPNDAYAQYFIGRSYLAPLASGSVPVSNVSFEPGQGLSNEWLEPVTDEEYGQLPSS